MVLSRQSKRLFMTMTECSCKVSIPEVLLFDKSRIQNKSTPCSAFTLDVSQQALLCARIVTRRTGVSSVYVSINIECTQTVKMKFIGREYYKQSISVTIVCYIQRTHRSTQCVCVSVRPCDLSFFDF